MNEISNQDLVYVDVQKNLLNSFQQVIDLAKQLPCLAFLNVSSNPLQIPAETRNHPDLCKAFTKLKVLVLNGCGVKWKDVGGFSKGGFYQLISLW